MVGYFFPVYAQYGDLVRNSGKGMVLYQTGQFFCQGVEKATFYYMVSRVKQRFVIIRFGSACKHVYIVSSG